MDLLNREVVETLMEQRGKGPCISIYFPTLKSGDGTRQNPIRLKNLLADAEERLTSLGVKRAEQKKLLEPAAQLINESIFWTNQSDGMSMFLSPGFFQFYRIPLHVEELVVVTESFHLKPLLSLLMSDNQFYVLALSQKNARLLRGTRDLVEDMDLSAVAQKFEETFLEELPEQYLQFHTGTPRRGDTRSAIYYGHGGEIDSVIKERLLKYFRFLDKELHSLLQAESSPLVLACVDYLAPLYQEANKYPLLMEDRILGNPENLSAEELHNKAWEIVQPYIQKKRDETIARYHEQKGTGKTSNNLHEILPGTFHGQIESLFVTVGIQRWGRYDPESNALHLPEEPLPGDEDLLDLAAAQTYLNGGTVYAVSQDLMPDLEPLAALLRW